MWAAALTTWSIATMMKLTVIISATGRSPDIAAPMAVPIMISSAIGVSSTRFSPNSFQPAGLVLLAGLLNELVSDAAHRQHVHPVHPLAGHVVGAGLLPDLGDGRGAVDGRAHPIEVVDADEHDRQAPELGDVERLVEGADVGGTIAKDAHHHLVFFLVVDGIAGAAGDGQRLADDGIAAVKPMLLAEQVHRAPATA